MKIIKSFKTELDPTEAQKVLLLRYSGAARFVYNFGIARKIEAFNARKDDKTIKIPSSFTLAKELRQQRADIAPWLVEYSSCVIDSTLPHCDKAFDNFFRKCKQKVKGKKGFPKFKSRKAGIGSIRFHKAYSVLECAIRLPRIGKIKLKERGYIPTEVIKYYSATISECAGRWFVSVNCEVEIEEPEKITKTVGVDFGITTLATCSDGTVFENPKTLKTNMRKLKRTQRCMDRRVKGSKNRDKAKRKLAKLHARIANIRKDALHNISSHLTRNSSVIVIEDLNVSGMMKNHHLAQAISDAGFGELRRQLEYKAEWNGREIVLADRWYPSSKTCSSCGSINKGLKLSHREWLCQDCGAFHDRDLNAAKNLESLAVKNIAATISEIKNACGEKSPGSQRIASETIFSEAGTQLVLGLSSP